MSAMIAAVSPVLAALTNAAAVSYTHLDVYKRQVWDLEQLANLDI